MSYAGSAGRVISTFGLISTYDRLNGIGRAEAIVIASQRGLVNIG